MTTEAPNERTHGDEEVTGEVDRALRDGGKDDGGNGQEERREVHG